MFTTGFEKKSDVFFRRLHCSRNTVHVNLFISFMLRALVNLLKDSLMAGGALEKDMVTGPNNETYFNEDSGSVSTLYYLFHLLVKCYERGLKHKVNLCEVLNQTGTSTISQSHLLDSKSCRP